MKLSSSLRKYVFLSLCGHLAVFNLFGFSFGSRLKAARPGVISFWGQYLNNFDFLPSREFVSTRVKKDTFFPLAQGERLLQNSGFLLKNDFKPVITSPINYALKPQAHFDVIGLKTVDLANAALSPLHLQRKESTVTFHPVLPSRFILYFKDRQVAHIGLEFKIASGERTNSIIVKRKIASGNLEVDLLTAHYLSHYLFLQRTRFPKDKWQSVKIELSAGQDK